MRNVTLAVDDTLLDQARALAARRQTTLNALVRSLLAREVEQEDRIARAREGMRKVIEESTLEFEPGTDVKELSRRHAAVFPGHQHPDMGSGKKSR
jgi:hypothetical protein